METSTKFQLCPIQLKSVTHKFDKKAQKNEIFVAILNKIFYLKSSSLILFYSCYFPLVYGSFRSLALEEDKNLDDTKDKNEESKANSSGIQTLDSLQAMCLPLGASVSLLVMFFFFDSMQMLFAICTAVIATVALAFLLLPMCQYLMRYKLNSGSRRTALFSAVALIFEPDLKLF